MSKVENNSQSGPLFETPKQTLNRIIGRGEERPGLAIVLHLGHQIPWHFEVSPISKINLGKLMLFEAHANSPQLLLALTLFPFSFSSRVASLDFVPSSR